MADDAFAPIAGFLTSLLDPKSPRTSREDPEPTTRTRRSRTQTEPEPTPSSAATAPTPAEPSTSTVVVVTSTSAVAPSATSTTSLTTSLEQSSSTTSSPATTTTSVPTAAVSASPPSQNSPNTGAIAGGVVGGLAVLAILTLGLVWLLRRPRKTANEKAVGKDEYQGSVVSLVAYGKDVPESRRSDSIWDSRPHSPRAIPPAHLPAPPLIYVTDECDTRQLLCELPGSEPVAEMESAQKYHAYRPKPS